MHTFYESRFLQLQLRERDHIHYRAVRTELFEMTQYNSVGIKYFNSSFYSFSLFASLRNALNSFVSSFVLLISSSILHDGGISAKASRAICNFPTPAILFYCPLLNILIPLWNICKVGLLKKLKKEGKIPMQGKRRRSREGNRKLSLSGSPCSQT